MSHTCHHPQCDIPVPPRLLACRSHWYMLPKALRDQVWQKYRPGQEKDKQPSQAYLDVIAQVQAYWREMDAKRGGEG
ncbi:MAG TPA: hypothetical protein VFA10_14510 [Ktedonobacteraceae bacterium]|nr:hypothetical protein [Ktedonobacteraceae bacterium]